MGQTDGQTDRLQQYHPNTSALLLLGGVATMHVRCWCFGYARTAACNTL